MPCIGPCDCFDSPVDWLQSTLNNTNVTYSHPAKELIMVFQGPATSCLHCIASAPADCDIVVDLRAAVREREIVWIVYSVGLVGLVTGRQL